MYTRKKYTLFILCFVVNSRAFTNHRIMAILPLSYGTSGADLEAQHVHNVPADVQQALDEINRTPLWPNIPAPLLGSAILASIATSAWAVSAGCQSDQFDQTKCDWGTAYALGSSMSLVFSTIAMVGNTFWVRHKHHRMIKQIQARADRGEFLLTTSQSETV